MTNRESFLQVWGMESATTQRVLDAVPEAKLDWRPDPKARPALDLVAHVAAHSQQLLALLETAQIRAGGTYPRKLKEINGMFGAALPKVDARLKATTDTAWDQTMAKLVAPDGSTMQSAPLGALAWLTLFDLIHHRAQLGVYIRPMGGKVPSIYGPSADTGGGM